MKKLVGLFSAAVFVLTGLFWAGAVRAEDKTVLAVVDFAIMEVDLESSVELTEGFRQALAKEGFFEIISRDAIERSFEQVDPVLKIKLDQTDCTNTSCAVRVGRETKASATIIGSVNQQDKKYIVTAKLINLDKRDVEFVATEECSSVKDLTAAAKALAKKVADWMPKPGESLEQVKQRRIAQQRKEEEQHEKALEEKRKQLAQRAKGTCPESMVLIPAGEYTDPTGKKVNVDEYCIDIFEFPNKKGTRPKVKMEWFGAKEECEAQGKRLCTEAEWEKACGGAEGRKYPYGKEYIAAKCNTEDSGKGGRILPSGECSECVSPYGVYDMSGNASEWTADWYDPNIRTIIGKGGSYSSKTKYASCGARRSEMPFNKRKDSGFRCCK